MKKAKLGLVLSAFGFVGSIFICAQGCPQSFADVKNCGCDVKLSKEEAFFADGGAIFEIKK